MGMVEIPDNPEEYKVVGKFMGMDVVEFTGKTKEYPYWECQGCYDRD